MAQLLLTGATGMVGREVLARAADDQRFSRIFCVVRPAGGLSAQIRLERLTTGLGLGIDPRVQAIPGDVTQPLDLPASARGAVTHVLHCAASVAFDLPWQEARRQNVTGTSHVLDLAHRMRRLKRVDVVSTCYVAGRRADLILESDLDHAAGFHNTYEQSKYEAELVLRAAMPELPIAVHRPSIVVGDSRTGATGSWKVLYWPLRVMARGLLPVLPYAPGGRLDIVPVDFVADAILALQRDPGAVGGTFHIAAGPGRDITAGEMFDLVFRLLDRRPPLRVPPLVFRRVIRPVLMLTPSARMRTTLHTGLVYRPYLDLPLRFDTSQADARLGAFELAAPDVRDYLDTIVRSALASDFGRNDAVSPPTVDGTSVMR